jgi:hypothetical protein
VAIAAAHGGRREIGVMTNHAGFQGYGAEEQSLPGDEHRIRRQALPNRESQQADSRQKPQTDQCSADGVQLA